MELFALDPISTLFTDPMKRRLVAFAAALLVLALVLAILRQVMRWIRQPPGPKLLDESLELDLATLPTSASRPRTLTIYHVPVRLAIVIIAPLGRDTEPPTHSEVPKLLDQVVPGLAAVLSRDETIVKIWPQQLSATGFAPTLTRHIRLPGNKGRGTPWCIAAGKTQFGDRSIALALALAAAEPNNLGVILLETEHQWLDILRIRPESDLFAHGGT